MRIIIGADHRGFALKSQLVLWLKKEGFSVLDGGARVLKRDDDYPDVSFRVARLVVRTKDAVGVLICGSGAGVCIAANKVKGVRAAQAFTLRDAKRMRSDDDVNVLCLSGDHTSLAKAKVLVRTFIATPFSGVARHTRRRDKIVTFEKK